MGIVVVFFLILIVLFIFLKFFNVDKYLPQITQQISQSLGRVVNIDHANLGLGFNGLSLDLKKISMSDNSHFSTTHLLEVEKVHLGLDWVALVLQREIHVIDVIVDSAHVSIVRLADGQINVQTLGQLSNPDANSKITLTQAPVTSSANTTPAMVLPVISVKSLLLEHAQISFEDRNPQMPMHILVEDIKAQINNFSLTQPFDFNVGFNVFSKGTKNIDINGHCRLDLNKTNVNISDLNIKTDLSQLDWSKIKAISPALENLPVIKGIFSIEIPQLNLSSKGMDALSFKVFLKQNLGEIVLSSETHGLLTIPVYSFQLQSKDIKVDEVVDEDNWPIVLKGTLVGQFSGSGESFSSTQMLNNLKGQGEFNLNDAKIEKLNILKIILDKINFIPGLGNILQGALPAAIKDKLDTDTTVLNKAHTKLKMENQIISVDDTQIESNVFSITAQGTVGFDLATNMDVKTYLASDVSSALVKSAKPLQGLLDDQNRLYIPGKVSGKIPSIAYQPQIDYITKKVATSEGAEQINKQLQKVLDKNPAVKSIFNAVFGDKKSQDGSDNASTDSSTSSSTSTDNQNQTQEEPSKKLINNVLKGIFR